MKKQNEITIEIKKPTKFKTIELDENGKAKTEKENAMNKKTEQKNETPKMRKPRAKRLFFLYAEGKGFLAYDDTGFPIFSCGKELARFNSKKEALYIASMCKRFKLADNLDVMAKVG